MRLSQTAPWNRDLTNPYRTRYTEHRGRYFRIEADTLTGPWFVWEITADGADVEIVALVWNLPQARLAVTMRVDGADSDAIDKATADLGGAGTGRNHPRNVARRNARRNAVRGR